MARFCCVWLDGSKGAAGVGSLTTTYSMCRRRMRSTSSRAAPSVRAQVKPVYHLDRVGRALPTTLGVRASTITDDDLDARVAAEPVGKHVGSAIVEQIDRSVGLKIHKQRAVAALLTAQGNIVNTQHARATIEIVILVRMQDPQERIRADRHSDLPREASAHLRRQPAGQSS
jgi:hypothetical protein